MIRIIGDTTSGMTLDQAKALGIEYIPQIIVFGEESYRDDTEIDSATFVKKLLEAPELPKTAAPPPALYNPIYEDMQKNGDCGIVICPSSSLSGTVRSATTALADFPGLDVRIVDTGSIGSPIAMVIKAVKKWVDEGKNLDEVEALAREMVSHCKFYALVDTLEYLHKGGRIGGAAKLFGEVLQIKPILTVDPAKGSVEVLEKQRTKKKAMSRMLDIVSDGLKNVEESSFSVSILESNPDKDLLKEEFKAKYNVENVPFFNAPPCLMVHAGPNVFIFSYFEK